jgi:DNA repair photolyase
MGRVWVSGVCDPYQAAEKQSRLTAGFLKILLEHQWPVTIQSKSSRVLRDIGILERFKDIEVGFSIYCHIYPNYLIFRLSLTEPA